MEHDIYTITPKMEADLTHVIALLDDVLEDMALTDTTDERVREAYDTLRALPFFKNF